MTTSLTVEIPDGTDRSGKVLRVEMWPRSFSSGCSSFVILFENQDDSLNGVFSPAKTNTVDIKVNNVDFMMGYIDKVQHLVFDREDVFRHLLRVSGRDYSQDVMNLIHTESYPYNTRIDDLIDDALADTGSEITYTSPGSGSQIAGGFEAKDDYLINIFRDVMERESYDGYVNASKAFQLTNLASPPASGITLKSIAGDATNNILATQPIEYTEADGIPIRNYIKIIGQRVRDGWTDGNASHWTGGANCTVTNDAITKKVGATSIKSTVVIDSSDNRFWLAFPKYNKTSLDWSIHGQEEMMMWVRQHFSTETLTMWLRLRLQDSAANKIVWWGGAVGSSGTWITKDDTWTWVGAPVGTECEIVDELPNPTTDDRWNYVTGSSFNWNIKRIEFRSEYVDAVTGVAQYIWIDDMRLPEEMIGISEDAGSQSSYRKRVVPIRKPYFKTQAEVNDYATSMKEVLKAPVEYLKLRADGTAGIIGSVNKWIPTNSLTVNIPRLGINSETWRFVNVHHIIEPRVDIGSGHDFITEAELVPESNKIIGYIFDALTTGRIEPHIGMLEQRMRNIEKKRSLSHLDVTTRGAEPT